MTPYAEAVETQVALSRWADSPASGQWWTGYVASIFSAGSARRWRDAALMSLETGVTFFWAPPMCELVQGAGATYPDAALRWDDPPADRAFMLFDRPLSMPPAVDKTGGTIVNDVAAVSWIGSYRDPAHPEVTETYAVLSGDPEPADNLASLELIFWSRLDGRGLVPTAFASWPVGERLSAFARGATVAPATWAARAGCLMAAFSLLRQQILVARSTPIDRAARRRLAHASVPHEPLVRVVELRRRVALDRAEPSGDPVEWSCRWLVRGHWRQQWCPAAQEHRPIWITPYIKGPESKPLKPPRATVFAVVR